MITQKKEVFILIFFVTLGLANCVFDWQDPWFFSDWLGQIFVWAKDLVFWLFLAVVALVVMHNWPEKKEVTR